MLLVVGLNLFSQINPTDYMIYNHILDNTFNQKPDTSSFENLSNWYSKQKFHNKKVDLFVIDIKTKLYPVKFDILKEAMPNIELSTFNDLIKKNKFSDTLNINKFSSDKMIVLIDGLKLNEIFKESNGWDFFYKLYPNSQGILTFSKVGYNIKGSQALIYIGNQSDWRAGAGYYVLLEKKNEFWIEKGFTLIWIS